MEEDRVLNRLHEIDTQLVVMDERVVALGQENDRLRAELADRAEALAEAESRALDVRPEVRAFALAMERKLRIRDGQYGDSWRTMTFLMLYARLQSEVRELVKADTGGMAHRVGEEAVDVANFCLFIHVRAQSKATPAGPVTF